MFVGALIGERREELMEQVAVGAMHFDEVEARAPPTSFRCILL
jgi:hypothetical protein